MQNLTPDTPFEMCMYPISVKKNSHDDHIGRDHVVHNVLVLVQVKAAHVAHVKLKTMRHPNVLKYIDGVEVCHYLKYMYRFP